jgi:hypothetical protein
MLRSARSAQERFERLRRRDAPTRLGPGGYRCDEVVGRLCIRHGPSGDWWPEPEPERTRAARQELLAELATAFAAHPGDAWVTGQLTAYRVEAREYAALERELSRCAVVEPLWWCPALVGYALHTLGAWEASEAAFATALDRMDPETRRRFTDPAPLLRGGMPSALDTLPPPIRAARIEAFWRLSDPLLLTPGNDRWTEHLARHTLAAVRSDAENPYDLRWGPDLEEALIRYGWEFGWERVEPPLTRADRSPSTVGHEHPESRSQLAPRGALLDPVGTDPAEWNPGARTDPEEGYANPWAPVILPLASEFLVFPRGDSVLVAAVARLPRDTSYHAGHDHPQLEGTRVGDGLEPEALLGALDPEGRLVSVDRRVGTAATPRLRLPAGEYVLSAEVWFPDSARAGRHRGGFRYAPQPADVAALSDLVLGAPGTPLPRDVDQLLDRAVEAAPYPGDTILVGWEVTGLGWTTETLRYSLTLERSGEGFLSRVGRFLGLSSPPPGVRLSWAEAGPDRPGAALRTSLLTIPPDAPPGQYTLEVTLESGGRGRLVRRRPLRVARPPR